MTATTSSSASTHPPTVRVGVRQFVRLEDCRRLLHMCSILADWLEGHTHMDSSMWIQAAAEKAAQIPPNKTEYEKEKGETQND